MNKQSNKEARDPIEVISSILALKDLNINQQDKFLKTPLHYACECGAMLSTLYMIQRGANLNIQDIYGNTPVGSSLLNNHWNLTIVLLQNKIDHFQLIYTENKDRIMRMFRREERRSRSSL